MHESTVFRRQMKKLPRDIHWEKTANPYRKGVLDYYLEATGGNIMWIETKLAPRATTTQQDRTIERMRKNGIPAVVLTREIRKDFTWEDEHGIQQGLTWPGVMQKIKEVLKYE